MTTTDTDRDVVRQWLADHGVSCPTTSFIDAFIHLMRGLTSPPTPRSNQ